MKQCNLSELQALSGDIAMMKCMFPQLASAKHDNDEEKRNDELHSDAGNMFGRHKGKAASKE